MENKSYLISVIAIIIIFLFGLIFIQVAGSLKTDFETDTFAGEDTLLLNNGSSGTLSQSPLSSSLSVKAKNRTWLDFDGVNDFVNLTNQHPNINYTQPRTISFWFKKPETSDSGVVLWGNANFTTGGFMFNSGTGNDIRWVQVLENGNTVSINNNNFMNANTWYNMVAVWNGTTHILYTEGVEGNTNVPAAPPLNSNANLVLGGSPFLESALFFNGSLDEIRIYNATLNLSEIVSINASGRIHSPNVLGTENDANLVRYFSLNENQGSVAYDTGSNQINGSISGAAYETDSINITLSASSYSLSVNNLTLEDDLYSWTQLIADYQYQVVASNTASTYINILIGLAALIIILFILKKTTDSLSQ